VEPKVAGRMFITSSEIVAAAVRTADVIFEFRIITNFIMLKMANFRSNLVTITN
jgi:hypothetical protein